jgi:hypothetical protein
MKPLIHAKSSAKKFGGNENDYLQIHQTMDTTKSAFGDNRHRAILHSAFGVFLMEKMFGMNLEKLRQLKEKHGWTEEEIGDIIGWKQESVESGTVFINSDSKEVSVRDVAELHCTEDFHGFIPSLHDWLCRIPFESWMSGFGKPSSAPIPARIPTNSSPVPARVSTDFPSIPILKMEPVTPIVKFSDNTFDPLKPEDQEYGVGGIILDDDANKYRKEVTDVLVKFVNPASD